MRRLLFPTLILLLIARLCAAQSAYTIKGTVTDTLNVSPLYLSSVVLMRTADSVMETYGRADDNGGFTIKASKAGKYILRIAHTGYADYADVINVTGEFTDLGTIPMLSKEHLLKEFVFTQQVAAIKIKGDTTEYVADSFKVKVGANVEDLLKRLPGIQVDKNGKITAQGTEVEKILVDGEEFFSDDPKVVTQGLQAAVVNKVQVFDKKSDQAEFTGIDDGEKTRTINLQLKENMKKGYFGRLEVGGGTDGYYQEQGMVNAFRGKRQLAAFGILSNTDKVGLGWQDNDKFGGGNSVTEVSDDGNWTTYINDFDEFGGWNGTYRGDGLPRVGTGGAHFANKWSEDKQHISGSYRYALQQANMSGSNSKLYALAGTTSRVNNETKKQFNSGGRNGLNGMYEWSIDSLTSLKLLASGGLKKIESLSQYETETYNIVDSIPGERTVNKRDINSTSDEQTLNVDLLLRRKFAKKGRTLSIDVKENYKDSKGSSMLNSATYIKGQAGSDIIDQQKEIGSNTLSINGKATYTEPLSKTLFAEANYNAMVNNSSSLNLSRDRSPVGSNYDVLRDSFSSNYLYNVMMNRGGVGIRYVDKKLNVSIGSDVSTTSFLQADRLHGDTSIAYKYLNFFPRANLTYKIGRQTSVRASYKGSTIQPTIQQIQPMSQNTDPLNIVIGNPALKQKFNNEFNIRFNNYKTLKDRYTYLGITLNTINSDISTAQTTDGPRYITQYVNVDGNYSGNWYAGYRMKLKKPAINIGANGNGNNSRTNSLVNGEKNTSINNSYTLGPEVSYWKEKKYEFSFEPSVTYNDNRSTINDMPVNYWVLNGEVSGEVQLPKDIELSSDVTVMLRQKTIIFTDNNKNVRWNAHVSKKFMKNKQLTVKLAVFDILNQNIGYTRTAQGNTITQNSYTTIRRYGMLSAIWNFTHSPMGAANASDDDDDD